MKWGKLETDKRKIIFLTQHIIRFWNSLARHFVKAINVAAFTEGLDFTQINSRDAQRLKPGILLNVDKELLEVI